MKVNVNRTAGCVVIPRTFQDNGKVVSCPIDNFPCDNPAYKKRDGFRCNDISLLDRLSFDQSFDPDLAKIVAARVKEYDTSKENSNLTEDQLKATLRPSWVQTAAEVKQWEEQVYQYMSNTADITKEQVETQLHNNEDSAPSSDTSSGDDVGSKSE